MGRAHSAGHPPLTPVKGPKIVKIGLKSLLGPFGRGQSFFFGLWGPARALRSRFYMILVATWAAFKPKALFRAIWG